jgi:hypothetical protein
MINRPTFRPSYDVPVPGLVEALEPCASRAGQAEIVTTGERRRRQVLERRADVITHVRRRPFIAAAREHHAASAADPHLLAIVLEFHCSDASGRIAAEGGRAVLEADVDSMIQRATQERCDQRLPATPLRAQQSP